MGIQLQPNCCGKRIWFSSFPDYAYGLGRTNKARIEWQTISSDTYVLIDGIYQFAAMQVSDVAFADDGTQYLYCGTNNTGTLLLDGKNGDVIRRVPLVHGPEVESLSNRGDFFFATPTGEPLHDKAVWGEWGYRETPAGSGTDDQQSPARLYVTNLDMTDTPVEIIARGDDAYQPGESYYRWQNNLCHTTDPKYELIYYATKQFKVVSSSLKGPRAFLRSVYLDGSGDTLFLSGYSDTSLASDIWCLQVDTDRELLFVLEGLQHPDDSTGPSYTTNLPQRILVVDVNGFVATTAIVTMPSTTEVIHQIYYNAKDQRLYYLQTTSSSLDPDVHGIRRCDPDGANDELWLPYDKIDSDALSSGFVTFGTFRLGRQYTTGDYLA